MTKNNLAYLLGVKQPHRQVSDRIVSVKQLINQAARFKLEALEIAAGADVELDELRQLLADLEITVMGVN